MSTVYCYRVRFTIPHHNSQNFLALVSEFLTPDSIAIDNIGTVGDIDHSIKSSQAMVSVELLFQTEPNEAVLQILLKTEGLTPTDYISDTLEDQNWVLASLQEMPSINTGRFYLYGSHIKPTKQTGKINLEINGGMAFGTGHHSTTTVCLKILSDLSKKFKPQKIADIGTGTGILAMGAAKLWGRKNIIASDIDPVCVTVTRENLSLNHVTPSIIAGQAVGTKAPFIQKSAPYDLLIANILARPLVTMAKDFSKVTQKNGYVLLSGLLWCQRKWVAAAYRSQGLQVVKFEKCGEWCGLLLRKPK
ncbi:MAG: ribosomal protein L11 methyltransferase [Alphaproteobacteria bacterium]|jgi:ribosomal protein L11 methyltransferase